MQLGNLGIEDGPIRKGSSTCWWRHHNTDGSRIPRSTSAGSGSRWSWSPGLACNAWIAPMRDAKRKGHPLFGSAVVGDVLRFVAGSRAADARFDGGRLGVLG